MSKSRPSLRDALKVVSRENTSDAPATGRPGRGRPRGGRSGDKTRYQALTVYIDREVHTEAAVRLARERGQFSDVIEALLRQWLAGRLNV